MGRIITFTWWNVNTVGLLIVLFMCVMTIATGLPFTSHSSAHEEIRLPKTRPQLHSHCHHCVDQVPTDRDRYQENNGFRIPGEYEPHSQSLMVWPGEETEKQAGSSFVTLSVASELANIATQIARFEPVTMIVDPMFLEGPQLVLLSKDPNIQILKLPADDIWARDSLPIFAIAESPFNSTIFGLDINYHKHWNDQVHNKDSSLSIKLLKEMNLEHSTASFNSEGGALEFDGERTLLVTQSSIFNPNRNPKFRSRKELERHLLSFFQLEKVIWLKGAYNTTDSTDVHVDALARFVEPGSIALHWPHPLGFNCPLCSEQAFKALSRGTDAKGRKFKITKLYEPNPQKIWRSWPNNYKKAPIYSYTNFLILNDAVLVPQFGDEDADALAASTLQSLFTSREIVPVPSIYIGNMGGAVHCVTRHVPRVV